MEPDKGKILLAALLQGKNLLAPKPCFVCKRTDRRRILGGLVGKVPNGTKGFVFWVCHECPWPSSEQLENSESSDLYAVFLEGDLNDHLPRLIAEVGLGKENKF